MVPQRSAIPAIRITRWARLALPALCVAASIGAAAPAAADPLPKTEKGFWAGNESTDRYYEHYIRITGDSGFYCVLDGKSSFAFARAGDSITTPMNGKDGLAYFYGSGDIVISGGEKGEAYANRFNPSSEAVYGAKCSGEDPWVKPVSVTPPVRGRGASPPLRAKGRPVRDALGRAGSPKRGAPSRPTGPIRF